MQHLLRLKTRPEIPIFVSLRSVCFVFSDWSFRIWPFVVKGFYWIMFLWTFIHLSIASFDQSCIWYRHLFLSAVMLRSMLVRDSHWRYACEVKMLRRYDCVMRYGVSICTILRFRSIVNWSAPIALLETVVVAILNKPYVWGYIWGWNLSFSLALAYGKAVSLLTIPFQIILGTTINPNKDKLPRL